MHPNLKKLESSLWEATDQLRAHAKRTPSEYAMPVLGLIFLRHATHRFETQNQTISVPLKAQYEYLLSLHKDEDLGGAINQAMTLIEAQAPTLLHNVLPKDYDQFDDGLLIKLLHIFNREELCSGEDDIFGRIYEYFLGKFAMNGAQEGGEFFTPPSLVRIIVNFIEPTQGKVLDPACGSGGMFVQAAHTADSSTTFHGREKTQTNTRLARMNMAIHGLNGDIQQGNTFSNPWSDMIGACDYVMANPPFNVDGVDPKLCNNDPRLFATIPSINIKTKSIGNANSLWIQYFHSYLNKKGRAGFVMHSSTTDAPHTEKTIRRQIIETRDIEIIMSVGTNFFYTRPLACTLWFFDKGREETQKDTILMIDARHIYRTVNRSIRDFSEDHIQRLSALVWLYRGQTERYLQRIHEYMVQIQAGIPTLKKALDALNIQLDTWTKKLSQFEDEKPFSEFLNKRNTTISRFYNQQKELFAQLQQEKNTLPTSTNDKQIDFQKQWVPIIEKLKSLQKLQKDVQNKNAQARKNRPSGHSWPNIRKHIEALQSAHNTVEEAIQSICQPFSNIVWLHTRFPEAKMAHVPGLCKVVTLDEIAQNNHSLTPGRYVGMAPSQTEEVATIDQRLKELHDELSHLNQEASTLARTIDVNLQDLLS